MAQVLELVETGCTLLRYTCRDADTKVAIDLSTVTRVDLVYSINGAAATTVAMSVTNAAGGVVEYTFDANDLEEGVIQLQVVLVYPSSVAHYQLNPYEIQVRRKVA